MVSHVAAVRSVAGWILFCFVKGGGRENCLGMWDVGIFGVCMGYGMDGKERVCSGFLGGVFIYFVWRGCCWGRILCLVFMLFPAS